MATIYIIESTGEQRQAWGPYATLAAAKRAAGARHVVVASARLANGQTMTRGALQAAVLTGSIRVIDGSDSRALA